MDLRVSVQDPKSVKANNLDIQVYKEMILVLKKIRESYLRIMYYV